MKIIPTDARQELGAAQFILGDGYTNWVWTERLKASGLVPKASIGWPISRASDLDSNVTQIKRKAKAP